jgi:hypothetical protein
MPDSREVIDEELLEEEDDDGHYYFTWFRTCLPLTLLDCIISPFLYYFLLSEIAGDRWIVIITLTLWKSLIMCIFWSLAFLISGLIVNNRDLWHRYLLMGLVWGVFCCGLVFFAYRYDRPTDLFEYFTMLLKTLVPCFIAYLLVGIQFWKRTT